MLADINNQNLLCNRKLISTKANSRTGALKKVRKVPGCHRNRSLTPKPARAGPSQCGRSLQLSCDVSFETPEATSFSSAHSSLPELHRSSPMFSLVQPASPSSSSPRPAPSVQTR